MTEAKLPHGYLENYLAAIRGRGRLTFSLEEVKKQFGMSNAATNQSIYRLKAKKQVAQVRKGFYAIIPPEYARQGMLPAHLLIGDLMQYLHRRYYVGLLSAAALHGAAHQQPMEYFVITEKPALRSIATPKLTLHFLVKSAWQSADVQNIKTDAGNITVSSPELTALDLLYYAETISVNRAVTVIKELNEAIKPASLRRVAKAYPQTATIQRLGYILQHLLHDEPLAAELWQVLKNKTIYPVLLHPGKEKNKNMQTKWKVIENVYIDADI